MSSIAFDSSKDEPKDEIASLLQMLFSSSDINLMFIL